MSPNLDLSLGIASPYFANDKKRDIQSNGLLFEHGQEDMPNDNGERVRL